MVQKGALTLITMFAFAVPFVALPGVAEPQMVTNSTLTGTILSASAHYPGQFPVPSPPVPIFTVPQDGFFILTQFCHNLLPGVGFFDTPTFSGNTLGRIGGGNCVTYNPGVVLPPGEILTCGAVGQFSPLTCTITGVLSNKWT